MRLRVTPHPASSYPARVAFPGCPVPRSLFAGPASDASGCPLASVLRLCRRCSARVAPNFACLRRCWFQRGSESPRCLPPPPCSARDGELGLPLVLHLRLHRRWIVELPRLSHPSAVPTCQSSSRPEPQPFGIADDSSPRLPQTSNPPAPADRYPSFLGSRTIRFALVESPSCPGHSPLATAIDQFPGCPKSRVFRRSPLPLVSSCPESRFPG